MPHPRVLSKKHVDKNVYELAKERVAHLYDLFDSVVVAFSGGKDSTAVLNVVYDAAKELDRLPLRVIFFDEEAIPMETEEYVRRTANRPGIDLRWYCIPIKYRNGCSRTDHWWYTWDPEQRDRWVRPLPPEAITTLPGYKGDDPKKRLAQVDCARLAFEASLGTVGQCLGIRASESLIRYRAVARKKLDNYIVKFTPDLKASEYQQIDLDYYHSVSRRGGLHLCYPVYDWTLQDIWTAVKLLGWDYNEAYSLMEMAGVPRTEQRCAPPYAQDTLRGLYLFKLCFPQIYERVCDRVEGARSAVMYGQTELYHYGSGWKAKPEATTWPQYVLAALQQWPDELRHDVAKRVRDEIERHYLATTEPILDVPHWLTGMSWPFLWQLASRGDEKNRKQADSGLNEGNRAQFKTRYEKALARFNEDPAYRGDFDTRSVDHG